MDKRTIIFRADGGPKIGMGHFIRTLALAEMLNKDFSCIYVTRKPTDYQEIEIKKVCHRKIDLPEDDSHFESFLEHLNGDEIVVLDNYYYNTNYQKAIKALGCKLVCIDDIHDKHFFADIIINQAEGIEPSIYSVEKNTKLLLGYKYALLRKEYLQTNEIVINKEFSCLLMIGGADPFNITEKILLLLNDFHFSLPIAVIIGSGYSKQLKQFQNIKIFQGISANQILRLMQQSNFGILPASTVAIEACAARLPFICGYFIDNQEEIYSGIKKNNLAVCIDNFLEIKSEKLIKAITEINNEYNSQKIIRNQIQKLDKKSNIRFIDIFKKL